jgi:predicted N-acetyltransferase YhbS
MQPSDVQPLEALYTQAFGGSAEHAEMAVSRLVGGQNIYVAEENGAPAAMLLAVPVSIRAHKGVCMAALAVQQAARGRGLGGGLLEYACEEQKKQGCTFAVLAAAEAGQFDFCAAHGFQKAFPLRKLHREIKRNIWSQAEFDAVPAKKLCELRQEYCPDVVGIRPEEMIPILTELYSRGITIVSSDEGYGLYFRKGETLHFIELMADGDRAAECLMEAAREKEVVVENAEIAIGADQNLFLGEGRRTEHGMIRFFGEPFDVSESYLRLILDV